MRSTAYITHVKRSIEIDEEINPELDALHEAKFRIGEHRLYNSSADTARRVVWFIKKLRYEGNIVDLGSGTGSLVTYLAIAFPKLNITGIELDTELYNYSLSATSGFGLANVGWLHADMREIKPKSDHLYILINPIEYNALRFLTQKILNFEGTSIVTASNATQHLIDNLGKPTCFDGTYVNLAYWT